MWPRRRRRIPAAASMGRGKMTNPSRRAATAPLEEPVPLGTGAEGGCGGQQRDRWAQRLACVRAWRQAAGAFNGRTPHGMRPAAAADACARPAPHGGGAHGDGDGECECDGAVQVGESRPYAHGEQRRHAAGGGEEDDDLPGVGSRTHRLGHAHTHALGLRLLLLLLL